MAGKIALVVGALGAGGMAVGSLLGLFGGPEVSLSRDGKTYTLKHVQVCFRHGSRTPLHPQPKSPSGEVTEVEWDKSMLKELPESRPLQITGPGGSPRPLSLMDKQQKSHLLPGGSAIGQLTMLGRKDTLQLGRQLRFLYDGFIPRDYDEARVFVRSTNIQRTLDSAQMVLTGLFGASGRSIPILTRPAEEETMYPNTLVCPRLREMLRDARVAAEGSKFKPLLERFASALHVKADSIHVDSVRDFLVSREAHGKELPKGFSHTDVQDANSAAADLASGMLAANGKDGLSLACGQFLGEIAERMVTPGPSVCLFSAHDSSLLALLLALNIFDGAWPKFASYISFELYQEKNDYTEYVRILYNEREMALPGCGGKALCPLDEFQAIVAQFVPKDFVAACRSQKSS